MSNYVDKLSNKSYAGLALGAFALSSPIVLEWLSEKKENTISMMILALGYTAGFAFTYFLPKM